jgi:nucleotidyltransferase/DNA polymerase involved in DNA repair
VTPLPASERKKMLAVHLCGPRVIARLESIGITRLQDLAERDPDQLVHQVNIAAGRPIWRPPIATQAMTNLIAAAQREPSPKTGRLDWP